MIGERDALAAQVKQLREALEPIAALTEVDGGPISWRIPAEVVHRARVALAVPLEPPSTLSEEDDIARANADGSDTSAAVPSSSLSAAQEPERE